MKIAVLAVAAIAAAMLTPVGAAAQQSAQQSARQVTVAVTDVRADGSLKLDLLGPAADRPLPVVSATKTQVQSIRPGDVVTVEFDRADNPERIARLLQVSRPVGCTARAVAILIALLVIGLFAAIATGVDLPKLLIGEDNRYSNSKTQLVLWFSAVMVIYLATLILRVWVWGWGSLGGVGFTTNLLALTGLSALTLGAAKAVTTTKRNNAMQEAPAKTAAAAAVAADSNSAAASAQAATDHDCKLAYNAVSAAAAKAAQVLAAEARAAADPKPSGTPRFFQNLFQNDKGQVDIGDFQMIFIATLAVGIFLFSGFHFLGLVPREATTLPDVDTTLLSSFGLGQGAYLVKKMASKPGEG